MIEQSEHFLMGIQCIGLESEAQMRQITGIDPDTGVEFEEFIIDKRDFEEPLIGPYGNPFLPSYSIFRIKRKDQILYPFEWDMTFYSMDCPEALSALLNLGFSREEINAVQGDPKAQLNLQLVMLDEPFLEVFNRREHLGTVDLLLKDPDVRRMENYRKRTPEDDLPL